MVGKQLLKRPLGELNWIVFSVRGCEAACCVVSVAHGDPTFAPQSGLKICSQNSWWHTMRVNNLWETWGVEAVGCSSAAVLSVSVYIWGGGNRQLRRACRPSKPKCSNCFVGTLETEIDQSLSPRLTACKWTRYDHALWPFNYTQGILMLSVRACVFTCVQYVCVWSLSTAAGCSDEKSKRAESRGLGDYRSRIVFTQNVTFMFDRQTLKRGSEGL